MIRHAPPILRPSQRLIAAGLLVALGIPAISGLQAAFGVQSLTGRLIPIILAGAVAATLITAGVTRTLRVLARVSAEDQAVCGQCGHSLRSVPDPVCPECGTRWDWAGDRGWLRSFWQRFTAQNTPGGPQRDGLKRDLPWLRRIDAIQLGTATSIFLGAFVVVWFVAPSAMRPGLTTALIVAPPILLRSGRLIAGSLICRRVAGSAWRTCPRCGRTRDDNHPCRRCGDASTLEEVRQAWFDRCPAHWEIERRAAHEPTARGSLAAAAAASERRQDRAM